MPPRLFTTRLILMMAAISAAYLLVSYFLIGYRPEQFPNASDDQGKILSLPMFAEITRAQQDEVIDLVRRF